MGGGCVSDHPPWGLRTPPYHSTPWCVWRASTNMSVSTVSPSLTRCAWKTVSGPVFDMVSDRRQLFVWDMGGGCVSDHPPWGLRSPPYHSTAWCVWRVSTNMSVGTVSPAVPLCVYTLVSDPVVPYILDADNCFAWDMGGGCVSDHPPWGLRTPPYHSTAWCVWRVSTNMSVGTVSPSAPLCI